MQRQPRSGRRSRQLGGGRGGYVLERMGSRAHVRCPEHPMCPRWPLIVALSNSVQITREVTSITASQNSGARSPQGSRPGVAVHSSRRRLVLSQASKSFKPARAIGVAEVVQSLVHSASNCLKDEAGAPTSFSALRLLSWRQTKSLRTHSTAEGETQLPLSEHAHACCPFYA